jgi:NADH-quinone oxidoreductase subunit I
VFRNFIHGFTTAWKGLSLTISHLFASNSKRNITPVSNDCIDIEAIKATEAIGQTSDGTTKRLYAAQFDIDMAKCMYCGLCTIVCPTECIVMTNQYDKSVFELKDLNYEFSDMTPEDAAEKRELLEKQLAERQAAKLAATPKKEGEE